MDYKKKEWFVLLIALAGYVKVIASSLGYHVPDDFLDALLNGIGVTVTLAGIIYKTDAYHKLKAWLEKDPRS